MKIKLQSLLTFGSRYKRSMLAAGTGILFLAIVFGIGIHIKQQQESNLSSLDTGINDLKSQIKNLSSATAPSKATITQKIATLEKQIKSLPETLPTKKELNQQLADLQQEINAFPDNSIPSKDRLSLEKDRLSLEKDLATARNAILGTLLQAASAIFFVITAYFTWRNVKAAEEKQITERFSKAVELLGSDKIEIRLGGIYALERVAWDSPKDHWIIMEVLTSFIREKSPLYKTFLDVLFNETSIGNSPPNITTDFQAALTVIGRRKFKECKGTIDLNFTTLKRANLKGANLSEANLQRVDLKEANLSEANLQKADLRFANLQKANLEGADLTNAHLGGANLRTSRIDDQTQLDEKWRRVWEIVNKPQSNRALKGSDLSYANLEGANLEGAFLQEANLEEAFLIKADLEGTNLKRAKNLTVEQVKSALNWEKAYYDDEFRQQLGL